MTVRSKDELKDIFINAHNSVANENFDLCDRVTTTLVNDNESEFKKLYKELSEKCLNKLKEYNITPEEIIIIQANITEWTALCIPYIVEIMERKKNHE